MGIFPVILLFFCQVDKIFRGIIFLKNTAIFDLNFEILINHDFMIC